jgi:hypothetical protein
MLPLDTLSKVIIPDDRENQFEDILVGYELGLGVFVIHFVLEVLN